MNIITAGGAETCSPEERSTFVDRVERHLLSRGICSLDGSDGMDYERADELADHIGEISDVQSRNAWSAGILVIGR